MDLMDILVINLEQLMRRSALNSQLKLARATGVSQTHIGNILRRDKIPSIDVVQRLAEGLGLEAWHLLAPPQWVAAGLDATFDDLLTAYLAAPAAERETILRVAQAQARYVPPD